MRSQTSWCMPIVALALLGSLPSRAAPVLDANKDGDLPLVYGVTTPEQSNLRSDSSPYAKCANGIGWTSEQPTAEVQVSKPGRFALRVTPDCNRRFAAALVHPDGSVTCLSDSATEVDLAAGRYPLFVFLDATGEYKALVRIDRPGEEAAILSAARERAPLLAPTEDGPNPLQQTLGPVVARLRVEEAGLACAQKAGVKQVAFVGRVKLPLGSKWRLTNQTLPGVRDKIFLWKAGGPCVMGGGDLDAGTYDLFVPAWLFEKQKEIALSVEDLERGLWFGDAPAHALGAFEKPVWVPLAPRRAEGAPDLLLNIEKPIKGMWVEVVTLGESKPTLVRLDRKDLKLGRYSDTVVAPGRVAVFAPDARADAQKDAPRWLVVRRSAPENTSYKVLLDRFGDPLARPEVKVAPPLAQRELDYVFPYLPQAKPVFVEGDYPIDEIFLAAPELLLFLKRDSGAAKKGEPVLLWRYGRKRSQVVRATGEKVSVRTERLSTTPIEGAMEWSWTFPEIRVPTKLHSFDDVNSADYLLPLSARPRFAAWRDKSMKIGKCISRFMKRNDPAYDKPYELIYVDSGQNVSDVVYKRARRKCGADRHDKMGERLIAQEITKEKRRRKIFAKALRKAIDKAAR